jgi:hypothetical protein
MSLLGVGALGAHTFRVEAFGVDWLGVGLARRALGG